jgi:hypothetical protein
MPATRLSSIFKFTSKQKEKIILVSGLPRSGTSMMMSMLEAGGIPILIDGIREADESNPKGYFEHERVKKLKDGDIDWIREAHGKVVKVVSPILEFLPPHHSYQIIFMKRDIHEILASQKQMLLQRGEPVAQVSDDRLYDLFQQHLRRVESWMSAQKNIQFIFIHYNEIIHVPGPSIAQINQFLGGYLDTEKMKTVIDQSLYRQKKDGMVNSK